jgi:glycosyltransferase involved in cell wall biosynthesis
VTAGDNGPDAPLRIVVVHNRYRSAQPSGENQVVDDEVALLVGAGGHQVIRYELDSDDIDRFSRAAKAAVPLRVAWSPSDAQRFRRLVEEYRPDVVHVHNVFPLISPSVPAVAHRLGIPVVATLHNYRLVCAAGTLLRSDEPCLDCVGRGPAPAVRHGCYRDSRLATLPLAGSIALHRAVGTWPRSVARFLVMSKFARDLMTRSGIPGSQIIVKPNSVPAPTTSRRGPGEGLVFVGRLSRHKGVDLLLDAWEPAMGRLIVVGDGEERDSLHRQASSLGVAVDFVGALPRDAVAGRVLGARALVQPSRAYETFGLAAAEAMALGVPAVVPDLGALAELVRDGVDGLTFASGDAMSLRRALRELSDPDAALRLGSAALAAYYERFTPELNLRALEGIYRSVIAG